MDLVKDTIKGKIYTVRGKQVMLDMDLAELYEVETKYLNKAVKRNKDRFPEEFCFRLIDAEFKGLRFQIGTSKRGGLRWIPYAFTEHGVTALSGVLKSKRAIEINIKIIKAFVSMRHFIMENAQLFKRLGYVENKLIEHDESIEKIFDAMQTKIPEKGIFFDGQIFDAYKFVSDLVRSANKEIILIDNYIDESVLTLFSKKNKGVKVTIYTKDISRQSRLDADKFNKQYGHMELKLFSKSHDRFLIIDSATYHIGASLKDLGKRWFAFSRFDKEGLLLLDKLKT